MIHIFGDSHANFNFKNIMYICNNHYQNSITMYKVGRDGLNYINFNNYNIKDGDTIIYQFGEIDCRCHIGKQIKLNRQLTEIIKELVLNYIKSIISNKSNRNLKIIICCVPPPINQEKYEKIHGKITHEFPFIGSNPERILYTKEINKELENQCKSYNLYFLNYYSDYEDQDGNLKYELSDTIVHINNNEKILEKLCKLI